MVDFISLAPYGFYGGDFGNFLLQLEQFGFFSYVLPFLIIFSLIFGILTRMNIFKDNKGINAVISISVGLMALQFGFVSNFFSELFPRVGVGLSILLVVLIFLGLFLDTSERWPNYVLLGLGVIIVLFILFTSAEFSGTGFGYFISNYAGTILIIIGIIVALSIVVNSTGSSESHKIGQSPLERALRGE